MVNQGQRNRSTLASARSRPKDVAARSFSGSTRPISGWVIIEASAASSGRGWSRGHLRYRLAVDGAGLLSEIDVVVEIRYYRQESAPQGRGERAPAIKGIGGGRRGQPQRLANRSAPLQFGLSQLPGAATQDGTSVLPRVYGCGTWLLPTFCIRRSTVASCRGTRRWGIRRHVQIAP